MAITGHPNAIAGVSALVLLLCAGPTDAQDRPNADDATCPKIWTYGQNETMQFKVDYLNGKKVLIADGGVDNNASVNLDTAIRQFQPVDEIWFRSPGGNSEQGTAIGRVIRKWGIPTRVPSGWGCASACTMAFLGGPIRYIDNGATYGVHMFTVVGSESFKKQIDLERTKGNVYNMLDELQKREQNGALTATEQDDYIIKMGISRKLLSEVIYKQLQKNYDGQGGSDIYCMDQDELKKYNVVNSGE